MHRIKGTDFNPRAPRGARPPPEKMFLSPHRFQSTCPARGTTFDQKSAALLDCISIHVPREGHDRRPVRFDIGNVISIHVPREGHDRKQTALFLLDIDFNPRAPRGARPPTFKDEFLYIAISIHVPREGHDHRRRLSTLSLRLFQSTCPARGTTRGQSISLKDVEFQSTCPARGTTTIQPRVTGAVSYFNPRAPRGARPLPGKTPYVARIISIHVPREGHDISRIKRVVHKLLFQSTCPARGTTHCI